MSRLFSQFKGCHILLLSSVGYCTIIYYCLKCERRKERFGFSMTSFVLIPGQGQGLMIARDDRFTSSLRVEQAGILVKILQGAIKNITFTILCSEY